MDSERFSRMMDLLTNGELGFDGNAVDLADGASLYVSSHSVHYLDHNLNLVSLSNNQQEAIFTMVEYRRRAAAHA